MWLNQLAECRVDNTLSWAFHIHLVNKRGETVYRCSNVTISAASNSIFLFVFDVMATLPLDRWLP